MVTPSQSESPALTDFSSRMTGAVKAELARRDLTGIDLAKALGMGRNALYERLRGEKPFDSLELERTAQFLEIDVETLLASADLGKAAVA